jgi:hypothetical protein
LLGAPVVGRRILGLLACLKESKVRARSFKFMIYNDFAILIDASDAECFKSSATFHPNFVQCAQNEHSA